MIDLTELDYNGFCDSEDDNVKSFASESLASLSYFSS